MCYYINTFRVFQTQVRNYNYVYLFNCYEQV